MSGRSFQGPLFLPLLSSACAALIAATSAIAADAPQHRTFQSRTCPVWDKDLHHLLDWSEAFSIHAPELQRSVRAEALKLRERCLRDLSMASLDRYVMLMKLLYDDEADEVESYD
ncbi:hypothetical protein [Bosea sp. BIWAKO-01]|uniref:hypothetical protein n=1 Tax=Bosea sp. BIWAKO-01 TaxID=506668 RepID=UPI0008534BF4|nr:hypothetical protein [Bosea sp. BIWAKO-01]GAU85812.1 hypothetical protein BIWAKO_05760 [Bosea sp. BIWAKO-01]